MGVLSGLFGVGGGFLITPLLFFIGIPPAVAVATGSNQVVASSVSGVLAHLKRKAVDIPMGLVLLAGGVGGSGVGHRASSTGCNRWARSIWWCSFPMCVFLGFIGLLMAQEGLRAWRRARDPGGAAAPSGISTIGCTTCR